jgi:heme-degrading monooxygenase HmoA
MLPPYSGTASRAVIVRVWRAEIDLTRADEYDRFAQERSLPMFRSHAGFRGCAFLRDAAKCTVITLWEEAEDVAALERSDRYRDTVTAIMAAGFVRSAEYPLAGPVVPPG